MNILKLNGPLRQFYIAIFLMLISFSLGIAGYWFLADYSLADAFYMTVITASTTGFMEVHPLDRTGRLFTAFYILFNLGIIAYFVTIITQYVFAGGIRQLVDAYLKERKIKNMEGHTIVCGYGRNGRKSCEELLKENVPFVVIENVSESTARGTIQSTAVFIRGDATQDEVLKEAGIERAWALITTLPKDADNVFITLTARELNPRIKIIARASEESSVSKLRMAGANRVVMPDYIGGLHMAYHVTKPEVVEFLEMLSGATSNALKMEELDFSQLKAEYRNQSLREMNIRKRTHVMVMGMKDARKGFSINPHPETVVREGDVLILLGNESALANFRNLYAES